MNHDPLITCSDILEYTDLAGDIDHCLHCRDSDDGGYEDCCDWPRPNKYGIEVVTCCKMYHLEDSITPEIAEEIVRQRGYR